MLTQTLTAASPFAGVYSGTSQPPWTLSAFVGESNFVDLIGFRASGTTTYTWMPIQLDENGEFHTNFYKGTTYYEYHVVLTSSNAAFSSSNTIENVTTTGVLLKQPANGVQYQNEGYYEGTWSGSQGKLHAVLAADGRFTLIEGSSFPFIGGQGFFDAQNQLTNFVATDNTSLTGSINPGTHTIAGSYRMSDGSAGTFSLARVKSNPSTTTRTPDVWYFGIVKGQIYQQAPGGIPVLAPTNAYASIALLRATASNNVSSASFQTPGGAVKTLLPVPRDPITFRTQEFFPAQSGLDTAYATGTYTATAVTAHDGTRSLPLILNAGTYPNAPQFNNLVQAQNIIPTSAYRLSWEAIPGATADDYIQVEVGNASSNVFMTPGLFMPNALNGFSNYVDIPANTLTASQNYTVTLAFARGTTTNFTTYLGVTGVTFYAAQTYAPIATGPAGTPPAISQQPLSRTNALGTSASFTVAATGTAPLTYQWYKNGDETDGVTTNATYTIDSVQTTDAGYFTVVVSNVGGSVTSAVAVLTVVAAPVITQQPQSRTNPVGTAANFTVVAAGTGPLAYQWRKDGVMIIGATDATFTIASVQTNDAGNYTVVVTNAAGSITSAVASLTVNAPQVAELLWQVPISGEIRSAPAMGRDGTIYVGSWDHQLYAFNPDGTSRWSFPGGNWFHAAPTIGADGTIYAANLDQKLYAVNPDGTKRWEFVTAGELYASPAIGADGTIYLGANGSRFHAIRPDGTEKWSVVVDADGIAYPAVGTDGAIYFTAGNASRNEGKLYAYNPDGTKRWEFTASNICGTPALAADGTIYFSTFWQPIPRLFAITPAGAKKWELPLENLMDWTGTSPVIGHDGTIYIGSNSNKLFAVNPDGTKKWEFATGGNIYASAAAGADGAVYVGSWDGHFYAVNPDGTLRWSYITGYDIASSPLLVSEGVVYVGGHNDSGRGALFAFRASSGPAQSSWPMLMRSAQRTGSVQQILVAERLEMGCGLLLEGIVGRAYRIEYLDQVASTNKWRTLTNLTLPASPYQFLDPEGQNHARRFYRTLLLP